MMTQLETPRSSNPQEYWKLLKSMKESRDNTSEKIPLQEWETYFKDLYTDNISGNSGHLKLNIFNEMDFKMNESEIILAIKKPKNKKNPQDLTLSATK